MANQAKERARQVGRMWTAWRDDRVGDDHQAPRRFAPTWMPTPLFVRLAYEFILRREPDEGGRRHYIDMMRSGTLSRIQMLDELRSSMEFRESVVVPDLIVSLHHSRCDFIRLLPPAKRIVDLGGTHQQDPRGALVAFGYPYGFDSLTIVDLPPDQRHAVYSESTLSGTVVTEKGPVTYQPGTMTDLGFLPDHSVDLVYSGQTIEHVTEEEGEQVLAEVARVLVPGGWFCLDTPNGPVCRRQQATMINDDHKIEYSDAELTAKLGRHGFDIQVALGLNHLGRNAASGFDVDEIVRNGGLFWDREHCYLLAYMARTPA
jgi:SAM-dependent methyltransferase